MKIPLLKDLDGAGKCEDIARANISLTKLKRCVAKNHPPFFYFLSRKFQVKIRVPTKRHSY